MASAEWVRGSDGMGFNCLAGGRGRLNWIFRVQIPPTLPSPHYEKLDSLSSVCRAEATSVATVACSLRLRGRDHATLPAEALIISGIIYNCWTESRLE